MKIVAEKFGNRNEVIEVFQNIIERRYEKLNKFFEDHIESLKSSVISRELTENIGYSDLDAIFASLNTKDFKQTSGELGEDIEKI